MEKSDSDLGDILYEERISILMTSRVALVATMLGLSVFFAVMLIEAVLLLIVGGTASIATALFLLILILPGIVVIAYLALKLGPLRLYEKGLTNRLGKFIPYEKLNRVHMYVVRPPYGCQVWFSKSLTRGPGLNLHLGQDDLDAYRHIELARRLEGLGLVVSATKHPKAEDDGLVEMTRGALLLEEPPEVFSAWRRRALIVYELLVLSPFLLTTALLAYIDLQILGSLGVMTTFIGPLMLMLGGLLAVLVFFVLPRSGWRFYERGLAIRVLTDQRRYVRYEDCAWAVLRQPWLFGTGALRVHLKPWGIVGDIPVGEKKHAYGDVDRIVELLESKGVPVER